MASKEAARRSCNCKRANARPGWDADIVAHDEFAWAMERLGWVLGIAFGVLFAVALIAG